MNFDLRLFTETLRNGVMVMTHMDACTGHVPFAKNIIHISLANINTVGWCLTDLTNER
jgi:hypothetical protein